MERERIEGGEDERIPRGWFPRMSDGSVCKATVGMCVLLGIKAFVVAWLYAMGLL